VVDAEHHALLIQALLLTCPGDLRAPARHWFDYACLHDWVDIDGFVQCRIDMFYWCSVWRWAGTLVLHAQ
jgi:hypothetical protein